MPDIRLTVKKLKESLDKAPDDMLVFTEQGNGDYPAYTAHEMETKSDGKYFLIY